MYLFNALNNYLRKNDMDYTIKSRICIYCLGKRGYKREGQGGRGQRASTTITTAREQQDKENKGFCCTEKMALSSGLGAQK